MKDWTQTSPEKTDEAKFIGDLGVMTTDGELIALFSILHTPGRLVFGGATNVGFLESGYMEMEEDETVDEALAELDDELGTYYRDGRDYCNRVVCNERM